MAVAPPIGPGGGFRHRRRRRSQPMSEINVTPFVDVMLVLLIVFMVSAPLMTAGVPIDLPSAPAKPLAVDKEPITVTIDPDGKIFIKEDEVPIEQLVPRLTEIAGGLDERIYVRGDRAVSYGAMMKVMGTINGAGFRQLGLIAVNEPDS
jgi:biopolymer transport protein TolR